METIFSLERFKNGSDWDEVLNTSADKCILFSLSSVKLYEHHRVYHQSQPQKTLAAVGGQGTGRTIAAGQECMSRDGKRKSKAVGRGRSPV